MKIRLMIATGAAAITLHGGNVELEIHICNYSAVSAESTILAEQETARIFERIGVTPTWKVCSTAPQEGFRASEPGDTSPVLVVRLLSESMTNKLQIGADIFGSAHLPKNDSFGVVADVYADRVRGLGHGKEFEVILGRIIAHELGHLLLGKNGHSAAGIMQPRIGSKDVEQGKQIATFFPDEAKRIRAQIIARVALGNAR